MGEDKSVLSCASSEASSTSVGGSSTAGTGLRCIAAIATLMVVTSSSSELAGRSCASVFGLSAARLGPAVLGGTGGVTFGQPERGWPALGERQNVQQGDLRGLLMLRCLVRSTFEGTSWEKCGR